MEHAHWWSWSVPIHLMAAHLSYVWQYRLSLTVTMHKLLLTLLISKEEHSNTFCFQDVIIEIKETKEKTATNIQHLMERVSYLESRPSLEGRLMNLIGEGERLLNASPCPSMYSIPFYTGCHGYKMCAHIYLNGDGVRGPFDSLLQCLSSKRSPSRFLISLVRSMCLCPDPNLSSFQPPGQWDEHCFWLPHVHTVGAPLEW